MIRKTLLLLISVVFFTACSKDSVQETQNVYDVDSVRDRATLRVATMYGATAYFKTDGKEYGYHFEMARNLADYLGVALDVKTVHREADLLQLLDSNLVDVVCFPITETKEIKEKYAVVFPKFNSHQVLIQRVGQDALLDVTDLAGKEVHVKDSTAFYSRLRNLNDEIGGSVCIVIADDDLSDDDLLEKVMLGEIPYTVAYYDHATLFRNYYPQLSYHVPVSLEQCRGWVLRKDDFLLDSLLTAWEEQPRVQALHQNLRRKYEKKNPYYSLRKMRQAGRISPYDALFKKYAPVVDWDWRLLAAVAFNESTFDPLSVSQAGAAGLMQLMPFTAAAYGLDSLDVFDPEDNIRAAVEYFKDLDKIFKKVENRDERVKFVLASYNGGQAHVLDAMALTRRYGRNPYVWNNNVEYFLAQKKEPVFYQSEVVKFGRFNAKEPINYVRNVLKTYESYLNY